MKKTKKTLAIAATFAVAMNMSGCVSPDDSTNDTSEVTTTSETKFNAEEEDIECVYGPPEAFEDEVHASMPEITLATASETSESTRSTYSGSGTTSTTSTATEVTEGTTEPSSTATAETTADETEATSETTPYEPAPGGNFGDDSYCVYGPPAWFEDLDIP